MASSTSPAQPLRILVIGNNDSGKSSLINKLSGRDDLAKVGGRITPTDHEKPLMELECICSTPNGDIPITFCDTQGFSDMTMENRKIAEVVADKMKAANIILICHRLYDKVNGTVREILAELARIFGNDLMKHTILVFTKGDHYPVYHDVTSRTNNEIKSEMVAHAEELTKAWKKALLSTGIKEEIVNDIPWCITSGHQDALPTSDDWTNELWALCENRCTPEAINFVGSIRKYAEMLKQVAITGSVPVIASAFGGTIGATIGTFIKPGEGTEAGKLLGAGIAVAAAEKLLP
uniref:AIG1-type G domain-containing protein n=1 Tax=Amphimedon queenslandica TaxID=400682 RepID=A0A1X7T086_AMPQE